MQANNNALNISKGFLIFILGLLTMLIPLSIDMYLPSMPTIASSFNVADSLVQLTLSCYLLGLALGQLVFGPLADSYGRRKILLIGLILFTTSGVLCGIAGSVYQLIWARFFQGFAGSAGIVTVSALMKDVFQNRDEFAKRMSFVMLISNIAPLIAPIFGGFILHWYNWETIFYILSSAAFLCLILVFFCIPETLAKEKRIEFSLIGVIRNFVVLFRNSQVLAYMMIGAFSMSGLFAFLSLGPFVYMNIHGVKAVNFGYYFAVNIMVMVSMNMINSRFVNRFGALTMMKFGMIIQFIMSVGLLVVTFLNLGFIPLVACVAGYIGCMAVVIGNSTAIILDVYPHIAGTASSLTGTIRFIVAGLMGVLLAIVAPSHTAEGLAENLTEWLMVGSMVVCNFLAVILFLLVKKNRATV